jgi:DNA modification methylase
VTCHVVINGDARRLPLADGVAQCCVTSPPYYGLRDYGADGQIGLEQTPADYVATMVAVFREVRRVLADDGVCWLNLGDSYASSGESTAWAPQNAPCKSGQWNSRRAGGGELPAKNLLGIPWRVAFALQADGWYLRSDVIWAKPNPMPESVRDRPTKAHEYVFLLTKRAAYYYDADAVRTRHADEDREANRPSRRDNLKKAVANGYSTYHIEEHQPSMDRPMAGHANGSILRTVWTINPRPFPGAHFATMPPELAERCIKAGTSEKGCCPACRKPWERVTDRGPLEGQRTGPGQPAHLTPQGYLRNGKSRCGTNTHVDHKGWQPTCGCPPADPIPCLVIDPFTGAGTTGSVAVGLGRRFVGTELNPTYAAMARRRIARPHAPVERPGRDSDLPLFNTREEVTA